MTTYTVTITEEQRQRVAETLAILVSAFTNARVQLEAPPAAQTAHPEPTAASAAPTATVDQRDRWARDREGNEVPNPQGCEAVNVCLLAHALGCYYHVARVNTVRRPAALDSHPSTHRGSPMNLAFAIVTLLCFAVVYACVAAFICLELNDGFRWWCPLCQLLGIVARRMRE